MNRYAPLLNWTDQNVFDWLMGMVEDDVRAVLKDLLQVTSQLVGVYGVKREPVGLGIWPPKITMIRFGCVGCPAVGTDKVMTSHKRERPELVPLEQLYGLWDQARAYHNRVWKDKDGKKRFGPIKMEVRKRLFARFLKIQERSGLRLIRDEDEAFIRGCWDRKVYPRGWSEEDELRCAHFREKGME
jgi:hypothetical protein